MFRYLYFFAVMLCREMLQIKHYVHVSYLEFFCCVASKVSLSCSRATHPLSNEHVEYRQVAHWNYSSNKWTLTWLPFVFFLKYYRNQE